MKDLNCNFIIKESPDVLSWNKDIYLFHYKQKEEIKRANMCVHMNLVSVVLEGTKEILGPGSKIIVPSGSGYFMKKGSYLVTDKVDDPEKGYESIIIFFSDEWIRSQVYSILGNVNKVVFGKISPHRSDMTLLPADELMYAFITQLKTCLTLNTDSKRLESILPLKILELFQILISAPEGHYFEKQLRSLDTHLNPDLVQLMQSHYKENISLEQYAFLANCSLSTFKRKFSQTFKMNPGKWIMERRLEEAYNLLRSEMNITEIAYEVGFETPAHFVASFKQKYRNTPKQLQQKL